MSHPPPARRLPGGDRLANSDDGTPIAMVGHDAGRAVADVGKEQPGLRRMVVDMPRADASRKAPRSAKATQAGA